MFQHGVGGKEAEHEIRNSPESRVYFWKRRRLDLPPIAFVYDATFQPPSTMLPVVNYYVAHSPGTPDSSLNTNFSFNRDLEGLWLTGSITT